MKYDYTWIDSFKSNYGTETDKYWVVLSDGVTYSDCWDYSLTKYTFRKQFSVGDFSFKKAPRHELPTEFLK